MKRHAAEFDDIELVTIRKTSSNAKGNKINSGLLTGRSNLTNRVQNSKPIEMPSDVDLSDALKSLKNCCANAG